MTKTTVVIARMDWLGNTVYLTDRNQWAKDPAMARRFANKKVAASTVRKQRSNWAGDNVRSELLLPLLPVCKGCGKPAVIWNARRKLCHACARKSYSDRNALADLFRYL